MDAEASSCPGVTSSKKPSPQDLDGYVDRAMDQTCQGRLGRYQLRVLVLLTSMWFITAMQTYMFGFITTEPDIEAPSGRTLILEAGDECTPRQFATYGPNCPELNSTSCGLDRKSHTGYRQLWDYRDPQNSATAEFHLSECSEHPDWLTIVGSTFWWFFGLGVSSAGIISDGRGRRFAWYLYLSIMLLGSTSLAMAAEKMSFTVARFITAFGVGGFSIVGYVWAAESLHAESQHYMAWVPNIYFIAGGCAPSIMTLATRDWRFSAWLYTLICVPWLFVCVPFYESPKWLAAKKREREVYQAMSGIAQINGTELSLVHISEYKAASSSLRESSSKYASYDGSKESEKHGDARSAEQEEDFRSLCHSLVLPRLFVTSALWFVVSYGYYGLSLFAPPDMFDGDPVLSWVFSFVVELPAYFAAGYLMRTPRVGRKIVAAGGTTLGGVILLIVSLKPYLPKEIEWFASAALYYPARMSIAAGFAVVYPWSAELFPSSVRNSAMGINSFCARMGSSLAPFVGEIDNFGFRMFLIAGPTVLVGVLAFLSLPETVGRPLPGTIADLDG